jgi:excinuclease ABC subunit A
MGRRQSTRADDSPPPTLRLRGAREHNLRDLDLDLPLGRWIAVTGPSGSGKTSLVFDTLVRESQRRYLGSLSARARHFLGKLGRSDVDHLSGLPVTIAVGAATSTHNPRSTVGTLSGLLSPLRLLFARAARDPGGAELSLSSFSFNHPQGACASCGGLGVEDQVDPLLLIADPTKSIRQRALRPTLAKGYTVYSQVTLEVMDRICRAHGFDVDTPWCELSREQQDVILYGTQALKVPFGKHSIESRMRWEGITARPREEGYYRGLVPVLRETLKRNRNANVLRYVRSAACSACDGSRLARPGREARLGSATLPWLMGRPLAALGADIDHLPVSAVWTALRPGVERRLERVSRLGLGHLSLDRESTSLSGGELQRLRLASQLTSGLSGLLLALDEPTLGLHPSGQAGMCDVLEELRGLGNTLLVVEHDPDMVRHADHLVSLGPGAGPAGGEVLHDGPLPSHPLGGPPTPRRTPRGRAGVISLRGATLHNLRQAALDVRLGALNVVVGPSGAGKSSLVFGTLLPALEGKPGGAFESLEGVPDKLVVRAVDASPIGRTPRSTPATYTGLFDLVRKRFAATPAARERGFKAGHFSYNGKAGRCPLCEGLGFERVGLHLLADVERPCQACRGGRYAPHVLAVELRGKDVAQVLELRVGEALTFFAGDEPIAALCGALDDLGLGYLRLGQSSTTLSRGEAQRVKLAALVGRRSRDPLLLVLDEPDRGLHPEDVGRLLRALDALVDDGHTLLAISHHRHLWAAADTLTTLSQGQAAPAASSSFDWTPLSLPQPPRPAAAPPEFIRLKGVRTHTLANFDVEIPHRALTVIAGVSGSGKSSLAFATLAAEAGRRFAESLPFQVRRHLRRLPRPDLDGASGLSPTLVLRQRQGRAGARSTVATQSGLGPLLRLLWSRAGRVEGRPCGLSAGHFSPNRVLGACPACEGRGEVSRCSPERLVSHPKRSLLEGALEATRPGRFFSEPDGQFMATLAAAVGREALQRPWEQLTAEERHTALYGSGERVFDVRWCYQRGKRSGEHRFEGTWDGLCALVEREARLRAKRKQAAAWAEPLAVQACEACRGARLGPESRAVLLGGWSLPQVLALSLTEARRALVATSEDEDSPVLEALLPELLERCDDLCALGLGHLSLARHSASLSDGELQRTRLASVLRSGLRGVTLVLDEPGAGLHARDVGTLLKHLERLVAAGNTLVVVSHRPQVLRAAAYLLELGPGAGPEGGRCVAAGPPAEVLGGESVTATALREPPAPPASAPGTVLAAGRITVRGAHAHNLAGLDLSFPAAGFVAVTGISGSGKSTLVFDVLGASAQAASPVGCASTEGLERFGEVCSSRASAGAAASPLDSLGLLPSLQKLFHARAKGSGLAKAAFSFRSPAGRCPTCKGTGRERVAMEVLADLWLTCPACEGRRYRPQVLSVRWEGLSAADFLSQPVSALRSLLPAGRLREGAAALMRVGLGHLSFGRRSSELSGGELPRLSLAAALVNSSPHTPSPRLVLLDEPARGLHERDLAGLVGVLREAAAAGNLVVAAVHRLSLIRAADEVIDLGPGSGPEGGRVVAQGPPGCLEEGATAEALTAFRGA